MGYTDPDNYVYLQIDERNFSRYEVVDGKRQPEQRKPHNVPQNAQVVHLSVAVKGTEIAVQVSQDGNTWQPIETWTRTAPRPLETGKFGFHLPGDDEVAISSFRFYPD